MKEVDYIIVGGGIAGLCFAHICFLQKKTFVLFDNNKRSASKVAGGMYNPVVLKRFTPIWKSKQQIQYSIPFFMNIQDELGTRFIEEMPLYRKFASVEEQNNWFSACDKLNLKDFLNQEIKINPFEFINGNFGFGEVKHCGKMEVAPFVEVYQQEIEKKEFLRKENFDYQILDLVEKTVKYKDYSAKNIIFAEGFSAKNNPYFNKLPLDGTKGELLIVRIPHLKLKSMIKSSVFIMPYKDDLYKVGATHNWNDKTDTPTTEAKNELLEGLESLIEGEYQVVEHLAGVRPTVNDRRPLVGTHYQYFNVHIINGLGSRGVLLGPYLAQSLFDYIEYGKELDKEMDINRYYKKQIGI